VYSARQIARMTKQLGDAYRAAEKRLIGYIRDAELTAYQRDHATLQLRLVHREMKALGLTTARWEQTYLPVLYGSGVAKVRAVLNRPRDEDFSTLHTEAVRLIGENMSLRMEDAITRIGRQVEDIFREAGLNALQEGTLLGETRREVTRRMIADLEKRGVAAFVDKSGRQWTLSSYGEMVARTTSREAVNAGVENEAAALGEDLVQVSSHADPCPLCEPWEDTILSLSGQSSEYPSLQDAEDDGLFHPNCIHSISVYIGEYANA